MERKYLLSHEGQFYKANLHAHTTNSDGQLTPEQMKKLYKDDGYNVIAYTDHNVLNYFKELSDPDFLVLCGYEVNASGDKNPCNFPKTCHLNAIARDPEKAVYIKKPDNYDIDTINSTIKKLVDANYIVNYNHPSWSAEESNNYLGLKNITAMEIYNHGCEVDTNDGDSRSHYDIILKHGLKWFCLATDDNHNYEYSTNEKIESDSLGGYTMIKASSLTYENIINAFDSGDFYCSMGHGAPKIYDYYIEDNKLCIDCDPVKGVFVKSNVIGRVFAKTSTTDSITHAEFDLSNLPNDLPFLRVEIVDSNRRMSFTNPYFL